MKFLSILLLSLIIFISGCTSNPPPETTTIASTTTITIQDTPSTTLGITASTIEVKEFLMVAKQWDFTPSTIEVNKGDTVKIIIENIDVTHGFSIPDFGINKNLQPGEETIIEFVADKEGTFPFACNVFCGSGHAIMSGKIVVNE
tara:strand:+ start:235 stop:669 length:435 start_codon:yes stop_codon:yes gene_type:complete